MDIPAPDRLVRLAVDLVNTRTLSPEQLTSPAAVREFLVEHGESDPITIDDAGLEAVRAVREQLRPVFRAEPAEAARVLNGLLEENAVRPYLSDHDGSPWHLHVAKPGATWAEWLAATTALGLASFVAAHGSKALGVCAAVDCERVFVNAAEKRPRRFCTPRCASRTRVASYRARQA
ncbi:CGNR zinc finger domain-containing protein [Kribbella sp. NPDC004536]|uniref:CGNR zinc finger domain-containing protein n=1 Tax=Kribbella sp. NPDC004536 TaxID=3364106 RepID=UPI003696B9C3